MTARPRQAASHVDFRDSPDSGGELGPQDSASQAPPRRNASAALEGRAATREVLERRTERKHTASRNTLQVRSKPVERPRGSANTADIRPKSRENGRPTTRPREMQDASNEDRKANSTSWKPQVFAIRETFAPLASRMSDPLAVSSLPTQLQPRPLKEITPEAQESAILRDLLCTFKGLEGQYIRYEDSPKPTEEKKRLAGVSFTILPGLDPSLKDLTNSMLRMGSHYSSIAAFVEIQSKWENGIINHALCASIRKLLDDYALLIAKLEHQLLTNPAFSLHILHLHTMPTSSMLLQLYTLSQEISKKNSVLQDDLDDDDEFDVDNILEQLEKGGDLAPGSMAKKICKGGSVLRLLTDRLSVISGDPTARDLLQNLLRDASRPYMSMLNEWLHHGGIKDPHAEFLIKEQKSIKRDHLEEDFTDEYWEKRYTIRENDVPPQLEGVKDKVLLAGKYLNVVRECGGVDFSTEVKDVPTSFDDPLFLKNINAAYAHANASLLNLLLTTHALPARLRSMKHYFFLDRSDFFSYFLFLSDSELKKSARSVNVGKLQSLLDLVLRQPGSVAAEDPYKEDVKIQMNDQSLTKFLMGVVSVKGFDEGMNDKSMERTQTPATQAVTEDDDKMNGFQALEFKYSVPFPLSLVVSSKTVVRYQILFRYLLSMRHLEGLILNSWEEHNKVMSWTHKSSDPALERWKRRAWTLRARMLNFVQQFTYYCTSEVIEPNWNILMTKVIGNDKAEKDPRTGQQYVNRTVDELMEDHVDFLDTCLKECMLMNSKLLKLHSKLLSCITLFSAYTTTLSRTLCSTDPSLASTPLALAYLTTQYPSKHHPIPEKLKTYDPDGLAKMQDMLSRYEDNFNKHLNMLLDALDYYAATETVALSRLCAQLSMASEKGGGIAGGGIGGIGGGGGQAFGLDGAAPGGRVGLR